jgi:CHAT domain-containing protein
MLLSPVIGREPQTKLIVVPDGKLNLLPFDALRDLEGRYVLESHTVTYAPSATVLHLLRESRFSDRATRDFLGVGGVIYSNLTAAMTTRASIDSRKPNVLADFFRPDAVTYPDLPGSTQEVVESAGVVRGSKQLLLDRDATEAAFKALPLSDFRILHLAVHGVALASLLRDAHGAHTHHRLEQEITRLGGHYAHVLDEHVDSRRDDASGESWLHGRFIYVLYRRARSR